MPNLEVAFILLNGCILLLVCFNEVQEWKYPLLLYILSAGTVLMTSLAGSYLVGSDIHLEYYYANLRAGVEVIPPWTGIPQGTSVLSYITNSLMVWKLVYPLIFATTPVLLYYVFKKFFPPLQSAIASALFVIFPAFFMELPGVPRQMVAEFFLVLLLYFLVVSRRKRRWVIILMCGVLMPLVHYAVGIVALVFLTPMLCEKSTRLLVGVGIVAIVVTSCVYFPLAEEGAVARKLAHIYNAWVPEKLEIPIEPIAEPVFLSPELAEHPPEVTPPSGLPFLKRYEALITSGLGLDFLEVGAWGKAFRVSQWIILLLMVVGAWKLRRYKEYWIFASGGAILTLLLIVPGFSNLLNATRFLHLSLILLAPLFALALKPKYLAVPLVMYFLFTSGLIFEMAKIDNIEKMEVPYSVGMSSYRMDLGASLTEDDALVRDYILENQLLPVASDIYGADFLGERVGWRDDLHIALRREPTEIHNMYVFVRSSNVQTGYFVAWNGIGCRKYVDPREYYSINWNENVIYQKGDARVIWVP